jgi:hypothetical protein
MYSVQGNSRHNYKQPFVVCSSGWQSQEAQTVKVRSPARPRISVKKVALFCKVDYTCLLDMQFGYAFHCRMRSRCYFQCWKLNYDVENIFDRKTHIQNAHPKVQVNQPLTMRRGHVSSTANEFLDRWKILQKQSISGILRTGEAVWKRSMTCHPIHV